LAGDIGHQVPTAFVATSPSGHWTIVCEANDDTDKNGELSVEVTQHGDLEGDELRHVLYVGTSSQPLDEFAGSDPEGRFVALVRNKRLELLDTVSDSVTTLEHADVRATQASYQPLRSVSFSDDGRWVAYASGEKDLSVRDLTTGKETSFTLEEPRLYRLRFVPGSRFVALEVVTVDTNKNGRLQWLVPERTEHARCPSPVPTYNVWQFPGDTPEVRLLDVNTGNLITPQGFAIAAGNVYVERRDDQSLLANEPGKPVRLVSTSECAGRVMHIDAASGNIVFGCAGAWGQRRQIFIRNQDARVALNFDLAAFELDTYLDTKEPNVAFYPGNQTLIFNVRTRERWPLLDGTLVLATAGSTALIELNQKLQLTKLNSDGSNSGITTPVARPPLSSLLTRGPWVSVGNHVFHLTRGTHEGAYATNDSPLALSNNGQGLYARRPSTPALLGSGPLRWSTPQPAR
jgi:hypothetical protein